MSFKLYKLDEIVYNYYITQTKRGKNTSLECAERKFLAMMLCPSLVHDNGIGCKRYQFGKFNILVRENEDYIGMVYWSDKNERVSRTQSQHLKNLYALLGLSFDGHEIIGEIDPEFETYLKEHKLSNTGEFRDHFKEWTLKILNTEV